MLKLDCVAKCFASQVNGQYEDRLMGCELTRVLFQVLNGLQTPMVWQLSTAGTETGEFGP